MMEDLAPMGGQDTLENLVMQETEEIMVIKEKLENQAIKAQLGLLENLEITAPKVDKEKKEMQDKMATQEKTEVPENMVQKVLKDTLGQKDLKGK